MYLKEKLSRRCEELFLDVPSSVIPARAASEAYGNYIDSYLLAGMSLPEAEETYIKHGHPLPKCFFTHAMVGGRVTGWVSAALRTRFVVTISNQ